MGTPPPPAPKYPLTLACTVLAGFFRSRQCLLLIGFAVCAAGTESPPPVVVAFLGPVVRFARLLVPSPSAHLINAPPPLLLLVAAVVTVFTVPAPPSPSQKDLLRGMLCKDPSKRLAVGAVLSHPWTEQVSPELATPLQPGEIEDQEQLAEAAREAIRGAKLAASEAERAAAAAQAAETNAAQALAAVKLAAVQSTAATSRPTIRRSASADSHHRRSASVDSHMDGVAAAAAAESGVRQDHEWSSRGHERTWSADDSVYAGGGGGGGGNVGAAAPHQSGGLNPPLAVAEAVLLEEGGGGGGKAVAGGGDGGASGGGGGGGRGSGGLVATKPSAWKRLVTRRSKFGRSQSVSHDNGSAAAESGGTKKPAGGGDGVVVVVSKTEQRAAPQGEGSSPLPKEGGSARTQTQGARPTIERSLSSAFAATSSSDSGAPAAPPPIEQSMSFDLTVAPAAAPATGAESGDAGKANVSDDNDRRLDVPNEVGADAMTLSKLEPAAEVRERSDVDGSPNGAVDKILGKAAAGAGGGAGNAIPTLSTAPTMSMSPPKQDRPSSSADFSAPSPLGREGGRPLASSTPVLVSPVGKTFTAPAAAKPVDAVPEKQGRPSTASHRPEFAPSSEPTLVAPASSSSSIGQPTDSAGAAAGPAALAESAAVESGEAVSRKAEPGSVADSRIEPPPAGSEEGMSCGAPEVACDAPGGGGGEDRGVAGDIVRDAGAEESVDEVSRCGDGCWC